MKKQEKTTEGKRVCSNCGQWQRRTPLRFPEPDKASYWECLNDCASKGFAEIIFIPKGESK